MFAVSLAVKKRKKRKNTNQGGWWWKSYTHTHIHASKLVHVKETILNKKRKWWKCLWSRWMRPKKRMSFKEIKRWNSIQTLDVCWWSNSCSGQTKIVIVNNLLFNRAVMIHLTARRIPFPLLIINKIELRVVYYLIKPPASDWPIQKLQDIGMKLCYNSKLMFWQHVSPLAKDSCKQHGGQCLFKCRKWFLAILIDMAKYWEQFWGTSGKNFFSLSSYLP